MSATANGVRPTTGDYRRVEIELADATLRNETLRSRLTEAERKLRQRLTPRQCRDILDRNTELERMNKILLERNVVLARKQRQRPPG